MNTISCDDKGRILLSKDLREQYGKEFVVVRAVDEIVLLPVPKDPLKILREEGRKLPKVSVSELKKKARELAVNEILHESRHEKG